MTTEKKTSLSSKRPRGAQPGNSNAVKHGFYSRKFHPQELNDLDLMLAGDLNDEIDMFRVVTRRVFDLLNEEKVKGGSPLSHWIGGLETMGKATTRLAQLLRTQHLIGRTADETIDTLKAALVKITEELKLDDRP